MICLKFAGNHYTEVSCDVPDSFIAVTRAELAQMTPFYLDIKSAVAISGAILLVMAVAFVLRQIRKTLEF